MPAREILYGLRVHVGLARFFVLTKQIKDADVIDGQAEWWAAEYTAHTTRRCLKELDQARHHLVFLLGMSKATKTAETPAVGALLRINGNLMDISGNS